MSKVKVDPVEVVGSRRRRRAQERLQIVEESYVHGSVGCAGSSGRPNIAATKGHLTG